jgi:hypothetical protein
MPPRRSTRATSLKPESQAAPQVLEKLVTRPKSQPTKKRAASPERASPAPKRSRTVSAQKPENDPPAPAPTKARKPTSKAAAPKKAPAPAAKKPQTKLAAIPEAPPAPVPQLKPYFNPLPVPPPSQRPGLQLFAWGAGNFGQFGMGPDILGELDKPKRNVWVEEQMQEGTFGGEGAGLESIVGGGLHTLFIDEKGTVSATIAYRVLCEKLIFIRCGHVVSMTMPPWEGLHTTSPILTMQMPSWTSTNSQVYHTRCNHWSTRSSEQSRLPAVTAFVPLSVIKEILEYGVLSG